MNEARVTSERVAVLEKALRFYADEENYRWSEGEPSKRGVIQSEDRGAKAREALRDSTHG